MSIASDADRIGLLAAGRVVRRVLTAMRGRVRPGVSTAELDAVARRVLDEHGARHAPRYLYDFPGDSCISVNDEAVHGIPGHRVLRPGDLVKLDVVAEKDGYLADAMITVGVPPISGQNRRLMLRVIAVEPMIAAGSGRVVEDDDGWTLRTADGSTAAHFEHTLVITRGQPLLLTAA